MPLRVSILAFSLAWAALAQGHAADGGTFAAGSHHLERVRIDGGDFVRTADGLHPATVEIAGDQGLVIDGGRFRTARPADLVRGIELARGRSIALYNKSPAGDDASKGVAGPAGGGHDLYTQDEVRRIFAEGDPARISAAFTSADARGVAPQPLTEAAVLVALRGAVALERARTLAAWRIASGRGDLVVNGGEFEFHSANQNLIAADAGRLVWNGGILRSSGGGGDTVLRGARAIALAGGSIASDGAAQGRIQPVQYDPRRRLDRDRWTLGKYLTLLTDGDIDVGRPGQPGGAQLRVADGMLRIAAATAAETPAPTRAPRYLRLHGGSISLEGRHRSTLLALEPEIEMTTVVDGGTLSVSSAPALVGSPLESVSMWNMRTVLEDGAINLDNAQLVGPDILIRGGTVNISGTSAIYSPRGALEISGGTLHVSPQSFVGAIKGDNRARSPYPSSQHDLLISGGTLNFRVAAPAPGQPLVVGVHIGGIHAGDNDPARLSHPTLRIGPDVRIDVDTGALAPGTYTVADFASVDAGDGTLEIIAPLQLGSGDGRYGGTLATDGRLTLVVR